MDANNSINTTITPDAIDGSAAASIASAASAYAQFALQAAALVPGQDGQLVLPEGVSLSDIRVSGRNLIVRMPDGSEVVIEDGAIVVPQFVIDGVAIPSVNLAALLVGQEPAPAAGPTSSSGGNFEQDPGDIGDPFGLGDLLPPTELAFPEPDPVEQLPELIDRDPDVNIQDGGPAGKDVTDNVSEVGLPGTRTNGNVESPGSSAGNGSDSTTGFIIVNSPDGIASITINGTTYTGVAGQQIVTANGVLTLGVLSGDQIPYTYRLTDNTSGDSTSDVFTVVLTDPDGDTSTARLTIVIADDVPTARADTDSIAGGTYGPEGGNVLTGTGTTSGATGADTLGADGAAVSGFRAGASGSFAAVGTTIAGQYGTLTLGANGSYTYVRNSNTPGGVSDVFTYQITDGDGDASTATLTINIGDAPNRITFVPEIGEGTEVRESHLPARDGEPSGSQFDGNSETTTGTITFTSPDGVASVTVSGVTLTPGSLPQTVVSNATGTLVVTGYTYNPTTGVGSITYTYTLNDNTLNTTGSTVSFPVVVTDLDGDAASDQLDIRIIDDAPAAVNDSGTQTSENASITVNVLSNDTPGADGVNAATGVSLVAGSLSGAGTVAYAGNGNFTYTPAAGEEGVVTFQYTITDGDGDPSTATVTITLLKDSEPQVDVSGGTTVNEAGLPARGSEPAGSDAASNSETTSGTIAVSTGGDTLQSLVINGVNVTAGGTVTGAHGTLTVTLSAGVYSYSYTLTDNTSGNTTSDSFTVVVTDSDGDSASDTLVVAITDDVPTAANDADSIAAGQYGPATGNVITDAEGDGGADVKGADNATVTAVSGAAAGTVGGSTAGQYGVLTLNADGSYSYVRNAGTPGGVTDVFSYTITDGDGDPSTATLTISIADSPTTLDLPTEGESGTQVNENGLPAGSAAGTNNELTSGTIAYTAPDGPASVTIDGVAITTVGQTFTGSFGTLTITSINEGVIGYDYLLTTNTSGDATFDDFAVVVTDKDGDSTPGTLTINIVDDVPTARADVDSVTEDGPTVADGNVITGANVADANTTDGVVDTKGADGATVTAVAFGGTSGTVGSALAGTYGSLTLNADGSYSYSLNNDDPRVQGLDSDDSLTEVFTYTITDGDGDPSTITLTITINGSDDIITINGLSVGGPDLIVDEDDLSDGSSPNAAALTQTGSFTVNGLDGIASVKIEGTETFVGQQFTTAYGKFTITSISAPADGNSTAITIGYSYELTDNTAHTNAGGENFLTELFDVEVTDTDGSTDTDQVEVRIIDDVPTAADDTDTMSGGNYGPVTGNVITDASAGDAADGDDGADTPGADGVTVISVSSVNVPANSDSTVDGSGYYEVNGQYGVLTIAPDGSYSYIRNPGTPGDVTDTFNYVIRDADGDLANANLTISVRDSGTTLDVPTTGEAGTSVSEVGLPARGAEPEGSGEEAAAGANGDTSEATSGTITFTAPDGPAVVTIEGKDGPVTISAAGQTVNGLNGVLTVNSYNAVSGTITYTYVLADNTSGDATSETFVVKVQDADDDSTTLNLVINIVDDVPTAANDADSIAAGQYGPATGNVITDAEGDGGADLKGADNATVTAVSGAAAGTVGGSTTGTYGVLTMNADGSYSYVRNAGTPGGVTDVFSYTITDGDGDPSTATLTISIADALPQTATNATVLLDDDALTGGNAGGTGDDANSANTSGTLSASGGDGPLAWALNTTGAPAGFSYVANGTGIDVFQGATKVLAITLNTATGAYTVSQIAPIVHANGGNENNQAFSLSYTVTDQDGDTAGGTLSIDADDDSPIAVNDTDTVLSGTYGPETGNVLTGAGTTSGAAGADSIGADGAAAGGAVTAITGTAAGTIGGSTTGTYGVLTMNADGSYSYVRNAGTPGGVSDVFTYTITDKDGDTTTATLTISIADALPQTATNATVLLDDDALTGGNAGGTGDDANSANTSGTLSASGGDGPLAWALNTTGAPAGFSYVANGTGIDVLQGTTKVLAITLNTATGAYTVTQVAPIVHANGGNENNQAFSLSYTVTDQDGDTAGGTLSIDVDDDSPIALTATTSGTVDEDGLANGIGGGVDDVAGTATTASGSVTGLFSAGADSPLTYSLSSNTAGLPALTSGGVALSYSVVGNVLTASAGATQVFTLSLDANTGGWTFTLLAKLDHPAGNNENDIALQFGGLIIATDKDGDPVTATGNLTVTVDDDTPTAANDTDAVTEDGTTVANGNVLTGVGSDGDAAGTDSLGADGPAVGGAVTAIAGGTIGAARAGSYGSLTLNADGSYTYTLSNSNASVQGLDTGETLTDVFTYTITDRDGDSTTATLTITINGTNDAPVVTPSTVSVSEEGLAGGNADSTGTTDTTNLAVNTGTIVATDVDGEALTYSLGNPGAVLTSGGLAVTWTGVGTGTLTGRVETSPGVFANVITVTIDSSGNYTVTLLDQVDHAGANVEDLKTFTVPVSVSDGTATTNTDITVNIEDDSPIALTATTSGTVDEDGLANGIGGGVDDVAGTATTASGSVTGLFSAGADSPLTYSLSSNTAGLPALTSGGVALSYSVVGNVLTASAGATQVFTLSLDANTGGWTFTLLAKLDHPAGNNENDIALQFGGLIIATDKDGDPVTATGNLTVTVDDDTPTATATAVPGEVAALDETATSSTTATLVTTNIGDDPDVAGSGRIAVATTSGAVVTAGGSYGADGANAVNPLIYGLVVTNAVSGLFVTDGAAINLVKEGALVVGRVASGTFAGKAAFAISINSSTGQVTVEQYLSLDHPTNPSPNDLVSLASGSLGATVTHIDGDGDQATSTAADISGQITFADDGPTLSTVTDLSVPNQINMLHGNIGFSYGADGPGVISLAPLTQITGITYSTDPATGTITAFAGGNPYFTISVNQTTGQYTVNVLTTRPVISEPLNFAAIAPGNYDTVTIGGSTFNGLQFSGTAATSFTNPSNSTDTINPSGNGFGVGNNLVADNEGFLFSYADASALTFDVNFQPNTNQAIITWVAYNSDPLNGGIPIETGSAITVTRDADGIVPVTIDPSLNFNYIVVRVDYPDIASGPNKQNSTNASARVENFAVVRDVIPPNQVISFEVTVRDGDGDVIGDSGKTIDLTFQGGPPLPPATPPVAIDLDGDGVEFLSTAAGVAFDYSGDGKPEGTAWVGSDDGLLAIDINGDKVANDGSEIVFGGNGLTDLQGLAAKYDSNKDGVLDANDADFAKFGVWQDANSNGVTDAGEFRSLTDAGITSINLVSDGVAYTAANGEVTVHGTASYTKADGTTGEVADASFATAGESKVAANENDQRVLASANTGMASSLVAAGLVAAIAGTTENASSLHEQIGGSEFVSRTVNENPADFAEVEATDRAGLLNDTSGIAGFDASDLAGSAKFSSYEQVEDHADGNFDDFGGMDSGSLISDLLASTEIDHGNFAQSGFAIGSHVDAASEALIAIQQGDMFAKAAVEEVVADALAGGSSEGANVDALLNALAGPANDTQLLGDTLSQQFGDHPAFEGFNLAAANDMLDQLASTHMELSAATGQHG